MTPESAQGLESRHRRRDGYEAHLPAGVWQIVATAGAALALPGLVPGLPLGVQVDFVMSGALIGTVAVMSWVREDALASVSAARSRLFMASVGPSTRYSPPTRGRQSETEAALRLRTLQEIARLRFNFPTDEYRDYKTYVNRPQTTMGVQMPGGAVAYPDIVVVQSPENYTKIVAQVETSESVNEDVALYEWGPYAELAPLYLYVPVGRGDEARALCRKLGVEVVGIRTWRYIVGYDEIEISDHFTV